MKFFSNRLKLVSALLVVSVMIAWLFVFPLHLALENCCLADVSSRHSACSCNCNRHFALNPVDFFSVNSLLAKTDFCSFCNLATLFFYSDLSRGSDSFPVDNVTTCVETAIRVYASEPFFAELARAPPPLKNSTI